MAKDRRRILYDKDGTQILETPPESVMKTDSTSVSRSPSYGNVEISLSEIVGTLISYTQFRVDKGGDGDGKCLICGASTAYPVRKICTDCMRAYSEQIYDESTSIAYDNVRISVNTNN